MNRELIVTELHPAIYDIAPSVSYAVYRRFGKFTELEDVRQECYRWAQERVLYINEKLSEENEDALKHNEQKIAWQMKRAAERYARREKASKSGYQLGDEAYYETATLAQLLPFVIASVLDGTVLEQAQEMIRDGLPKGSSSPAEGGNLLATLIDTKRAFVELSDEDKHILILRYHHAETLERIAKLLECAVSTADRKCSAALRRLQQELGGETPFK